MVDCTCTLLLLALVSLSTGRLFALEQKALDNTTLNRLLSLPQPLARYNGQPSVLFEWKDCGFANASVQFRNLSLSPDPIVVPGNVTVAVNVVLKENLTSPIKMIVTIKKKVLVFYVPIPCTDGFGSCTYNNICSLISETKCPKPFVDQKILCKCPIEARNYTLPATEFEVKLPSNLPKSLANGDYEAEARVYDAKGREAGCLSLDLSLQVQSLISHKFGTDINEL